jgi:hypothetical protein
MIPAHINLESRPHYQDLHRKHIPPSYHPTVAARYPTHTSNAPHPSDTAMTDRILVGSNKQPSNPTPLSAPQEQQVRDLYYKNVRAKCAVEIESTLSSLSAVRRK